MDDRLRLETLSARLSQLTADAAPKLVAIHSHRAGTGDERALDRPSDQHANDPSSSTDAVLQDITEPTGRQIAQEDFQKVPASLKPLFTAFAYDCDRADTPALLLETYLSLLIQKLAFAKQSPERRGLSTAQYNKIVEYLNARPEQDVTLAGLAALVGLSPSHFARAFTASAGMPPHRFQIEMRIERAKKMLENTDMSIGEVAALSGYEDAGYFARSFRNEVGVTPMHYRRTIRL